MQAVRISNSTDRRLAQYTSAIFAYPFLSIESEQALCARWRDRHDLSASHELVTSHLRLVVAIAQKYRGYGLPPEDLIGEGQVGLMRAVCRFDPDRSCRFASYAIFWIRAAIQEYIIRNWSLVRVGTNASQRTLFFNLRRLQSQIREFDGGELPPDHVSKIAGALRVARREVISMSRRMAGGDLSLNAPISQAHDGDWQDRLVESADDQETTLIEREESDQRRKLLRTALSKLSARERDIVVGRRLCDSPASLKDLAKSHALSSERIRQIELRALTKLRDSVALLSTRA